MTGLFGTTAGEWRIFEDTYTHVDFDGTETEQIQGYNIESDAGEIIGCEGIIPGGDSWANAKAIAQVPAMLALVERLSAMAAKGGRYETGPLPDYVEDARAIVAKL